jgi:glucose-1-phosphate adenylyltransferase
MKDTLGVLLAGGAGERLYPLTRDRAKPAVTFGGIYRIIDITLSNCINSDLRRVHILLSTRRYRKPPYPRRLEYCRHELGNLSRCRRKRVSDEWYQGTLMRFTRIFTPSGRTTRYVLILSGDHILQDEL